MAYLDIAWQDELICAYSENENIVVMVYRGLDEIPKFSDFVQTCYEFNDQKILDVLLETGTINDEYEAEQLTEEILEALIDKGYFDDFDEYLYEIIKKYSLLVILDDFSEYAEFLQIEDSDTIIIGEAQNSLLSKFSINGITCVQGLTIMQGNEVLSLEGGNNG